MRGAQAPAFSPGLQSLDALLVELSRSHPSSFAFLLSVTDSQPGPRPRAGILTLAVDGKIEQTCQIEDMAHSAFGAVLSTDFRTQRGGLCSRFPQDTTLAALRIENFLGIPLKDRRNQELGAIGLLRQTAEPFQADEEAHLTGFTGRAVAELLYRRAKTELAIERQRHGLLLRSIKEGVLRLDAAGRILEMNGCAEALTGCLQSQSIGLPLEDVCHWIDPRSRRPLIQTTARLLRTRIAGELAKPQLLVSADHSEQLIETHVTWLNEPAGGFLISLRQAAALARPPRLAAPSANSESFSRAASAIAHDFNNLLTTILGNLSLALNDRTLPQSVAEHLLSAKKAGLRAQGLSQQLGSLAPTARPNKQTVALQELLHDTLRFSLQNSAVALKEHIDQELWAADIDPDQIAEVFDTLVTHAQRAMPGGGTLLVTASNFRLKTDSPQLKLQAGVYLKISLHNEAPTLAAEPDTKSFAPATSGGAGTNPEWTRALLLLDGHCGAMETVSSNSQGSTFNVYLPAIDTFTSEQLTLTLDTPPQTDALRILVLDDEAPLCELMRCVLQPQGYEVTGTQDGPAAIAAYRAAIDQGRPFQLVITDISLPGGMDGEETLRHIRELNPTVKALVCSGHNVDPIVDDFRRFGFCGIVRKPYDIGALSRIVAEAIAL